MIEKQGVVAQARAWAASAAPDQLRAVAFAAHEAMPPDMQAAFLAYLQRHASCRLFGPIFAEAAAEYRAERDRRQRITTGER